MNFRLERVLLNKTVSLFSRYNNSKICKFVNKRYYHPHLLYLYPRYQLKITYRRYCSVQEETETFEYESNYDNIDFGAIANGDEEKVQLLKLYQLEIDVMFQQGDRVPTVMKEKDWLELLLLPTRTSRIKHLNFLWLNEVKKDNRKKKQAIKQTAFDEKKAKGEINAPSPHLNYCLAHNTMFHRIYETDMNRFYNLRTLRAVMFGYDIVVDCSYCEYMTRKEIANCTKQLVYMIGENRMHKDPFNIIFCNMKDDNILYEKLKFYIPTLEDLAFPFKRTEKHYLELYPKDRLVYLSPHCKEELEEFNADDVYIIGAMVDKTRTEPLSMAKAKRDKIRVAKFPLDKYLHWGCGIKSLPLNQVMGIMNDLKVSGDWNVAFKHIPNRKLMSHTISPEREEDRIEKLTIKSIRDKYRRNAIYDLLLKESLK